MIEWLLDGSVIVALALDQHPDHHRCQAWFAKEVQQFATCSVTQGTLLRLHMQFASDRSAAAAWKSLNGFVVHPMHQFWSDGFSYTEVTRWSIQGHRQATDAWLMELARRRGGRLATLDTGLYALDPKIVHLVPAYAGGLPKFDDSGMR